MAYRGEQRLKDSKREHTENQITLFAITAVKKL